MKHYVSPEELVIGEYYCDCSLGSGAEPLHYIFKLVGNFPEISRIELEWQDDHEQTGYSYGSMRQCKPLSLLEKRLYGLKT